MNNATRKQPNSATESVSKNTLKQRRRRAKLKEDGGDKLQAEREKDRLRKQEQRADKRKRAEKNPKLMHEVREKKNLEMKRYRAKKRADNNSKNTPKSVAAKQRESKKAKERSAQKKIDALEKKVAKLHAKNWRMRVQFSGAEENQPSTSGGFNSESAKKRAVRKAKLGIPTTPTKKIEVLQKIITPSSRRRLEEAGTLQGGTAEKVMSSLKARIANMRPKGTVSQKLRPGYCLLKRVVSSAGAKALKECQVRRGGKANDDFRQRRRDALPNHVLEMVRIFYLRDDISRQLPDTKFTMKVGGERVPRHVMRCTLEEAHTKFCQESQLSIGYISFTKLRPPQVRKVTETDRKTCLCQMCCNAKLKSEALQKHAKANEYNISIEVSNTKLARRSFCVYESWPKPICVARSCETCGPSIYLNEIKAAINETDTIEFFKWGRKKIQKGDKSKMVTTCEKYSLSIDLFLEEYNTDIRELGPHLFRADWQHKQQQALLSNLPNKQVVLCMDFANSYQCIYAAETQNAFFDQVPVTIHPMMLYYKLSIGEQSTMVKHTIIGITTQDKDAYSVKAFEDWAVNRAREELKLSSTDPVVVHEFTDGCASQYKGRNAFYDMASSSPLNLIQRNFYETSHGKSVCDGLGATVKYNVGQAVIRGKAVVSDARSFYEYCVENLTNPFKLANGEVTRREYFYLDEVVKDRPEVKQLKTQVRNVHSSKKVPGSRLAVRHLSCYMECCIRGTQNCQNEGYCGEWTTVAFQTKSSNQLPGTTNQQQHENMSEAPENSARSETTHIPTTSGSSRKSVEVGDLIAVAYPEQPFVGIVKEIVGGDVTTEFMTGGTKLKWPARPDIDMHPANIILECRPEVVPDRTGRYSIVANKSVIDAEYSAFSEKYL